LQDKSQAKILPCMPKYYYYPGDLFCDTNLSFCSFINALIGVWSATVFFSKKKINCVFSFWNELNLLSYDEIIATISATGRYWFHNQQQPNG
jgi:hypothetical protein